MFLTLCLLNLISIEPHQFFLASDFELGPTQFTIVGIEPANEFTDLGIGESEVAEALIERAKDWRILHRKSFYPGVDSSFFSNLERSKNILNGRKASIIVFPTNNPKDIAATLELGWRGNSKDLLPSEDAFSIQFSDSTLAEILSLDIDKNMRVDFLPILLKIFDHYGITKLRVKGPQERWEQPSRFILTCFHEVAPRYRRIGFAFSHEQPDSKKWPGVVAMDISHSHYQDDFIPKMTEKFWARALNLNSNSDRIKSTSFEKIAEEWQIHFDPSGCTRHLGLLSKILSKKFPPGALQIRAIVRSTPAQY